jgi:hypothetical protein
MQGRLGGEGGTQLLRVHARYCRGIQASDPRCQRRWRGESSLERYLLVQHHSDEQGERVA